MNSLNDIKGRAKIRVKIDRLSLGNFNDCKSIGNGLHEIKIDYGPGYRVYFGHGEPNSIVLLYGGDKDSQISDIKKAMEYWNDYRR
ncbi:MAG: type II toxin-antitoxin system RelE/ParE family toxin [Nitrospirae bacterium]|nr:type II toxin-antitoxin system RelE/ParE family toxin [Nitrospirota bacterium]